MGFNLWTNAMSERPAHPVKQWGTWKGNKFVYWDKEFENKDWTKGKEFDFEVPAEFIVVADSHSAGGWIDSENTWVCSNELFFWDEPLIVKTTKKDNQKTLMKWIYKDIKSDFKARKFEMKTNLYIITPDNPDDIRIIQLRWAQLTDLTNSDAGKPYATSSYKLKMDPVLRKGKKGRNEYEYPHFDIASALTPEEKELQAKAAQRVLEYHNATKPTQQEFDEEKVEEPVTIASAPETDLPF